MPTKTIRIACEAADTIALDELNEFQGDLKTLSDDDADKLKQVILTYGFSAPILAWKNGRGAYILDGHQRLKVLSSMREDGYTVPPLPVDWIKARSKKEAKQKLLTITSSYGKASKAGLEHYVLDADLQLYDVLPEIRLPEVTIKTPTRPKVDDLPAVLETVVTDEGDVWELGEHRVMCGDSTNQENVDALLDGAEVDAFLMDPPYCSGGFQESGRAQGSVGTVRVADDGSTYAPKIKNDTLSTRGYVTLMKDVHQRWRPSFSYTFTDWRMWVYLFDVMESCGFGIRNMIVWNKCTPGMGRGWRTQHEIIMFGASEVPAFDNHKVVGNVLSVDRTGNPDHPTQKPVEVLSAILHVSDFCKVIADPFGGSGSTLIACEEVGRKCLVMESDRAFCDVTVNRYREWCLANGKTPVIKRNGRAL